MSGGGTWLTTVVVIVAVVFILGVILQGIVQFSARGLLHKIHYATEDDALRDFTASAGTGKPKDRAKGIRMLARGEVHAEALAALPEPLRTKLARLRIAERIAWTTYGALAFVWVGALVIEG